MASPMRSLLFVVRLASFTGFCYHVSLCTWARQDACLNVRLREHVSTITNSASANLRALCKKCGYHPLFDETVVLYRHNNHFVRELVEAFFINEHSNKCVSKSSITLHGQKHALIGTMFSNP